MWLSSSFILLLLGILLPLRAEDLFEEKVRPFLSGRCYPCHSATPASNLRLDSREGMLKGGSLGPAIVPGDAPNSLLIAALRHTHARLKMPPSGKATEDEISAVERWINAGATWPKAAPQGPKPKSLWSTANLRPPTRRTLDEIAGTNLSITRDPRTLLRRLSIDLTGLPPTFDEVSRNRPYEEAVDRLLASPQFGERWARHWLDVARYAEDDVRGLGQAQYPNAWRYRDWVIQAFNEDLPYDRFIRLQIAADLDPRPGHDDRAALGLFGLGPWYYSNAPPPEARADERHDRVDVLTRGFLGLTVGCARCHDHKFDPIPTRDYYALAQVFARTQYTEYPLATEEDVHKWDRHKQRIDDLERNIKEFLQSQARQLSEILAHDTAAYLTAIRDAGAKPNWKKLAKQRNLDEETLERWRKYLDRPQHDHPLLAGWKTDPQRFQALVLSLLAEKKEVDDDNEAAIAPTRPKRNAAKTRLPNGFETYDEFCPGCNVVARSMERDRYMLWNDLFKPADKKGGGVLYYGAEEIPRLLQGSWRTHLDRMRAELEELKRTLPEQYPYLHAIGERTDLKRLRIHLRGNAYNLGDEAPQRFLTLAGGQPLDQGSGRLQLAGIVSRHPLAARVAVNRIWGELFGEYIVGSPSNFGTMGERPKNPELLEELSARFAANGYSMKKLIREIVMSNAYRTQPSRRRLDAEAIRDSMLFASGLLDARLGGPSVDLAKDRTRRSIYGKVSRFELDRSLALFDFPNPGITNEKRVVTHVPTQQLFFLNSDFVAHVASALAATPDIGVTYRRLFARDPSPKELELAKRFLAQADFASYAQVLLSSNEFYFVD